MFCLYCGSSYCVVQQPGKQQVMHGYCSLFDLSFCFVVSVYDIHSSRVLHKGVLAATPLI